MSRSYPGRRRHGLELFHHRNSAPANRRRWSARRGLGWVMLCNNSTSLGSLVPEIIAVGGTLCLPRAL